MNTSSYKHSLDVVSDVLFTVLSYILTNPEAYFVTVHSEVLQGTVSN